MHALKNPRASVKIASASAWLVTFLITAVTVSQTPNRSGQSLPTIEQVLDKHEQAVGGHDAWEKIHTLHEIDTVEFLRSRETTVAEKWFASNRYYLATKRRSAVFKTGFDGETGWSISPQFGFKMLSGEDLSPLRWEAMFPIETRLRELVSRMKLRGKTQVGKHATYAVEVKFSQGFAATMYFDSNTWVIVREDVAQTNSFGSQIEEAYYDDYREVPDLKVKLAFRTTEKSPQYTVVSIVKELHFNVPVDESLFKPPSNTLHIQR